MTTFLKPTKATKESVVYTFGTFDIETAHDGSLLDIGFFFYPTYHTFTTWQDFLDFLTTVECEVLYAHNGGRFDTIALLYAAIQESIPIEKVEGLLVSDSVISLSLEYKGKALVIKDSASLLPSPLKTLTADFGVDYIKKEVPDIFKSCMGVYKMLYPTAYYNYLKHDVLGLHGVLTKTLDLLKEDGIHTLPLTASSLAMRLYRSKYLDKPLPIPSTTIAAKSRAVYSGGRCEYVGDGVKTVRRYEGKNLSVYEGVTIIDVNSMYPAVMLELYPTSPLIYTDTIKYEMCGKKLKLGFYDCFFKQSEDLKYASIFGGYEDEGKCLMREGEAFLTSIEIEHLLSYGGVVEVKSGYYAEDSDYIFKEYILDMYARRVKAKEEGRKTADILYKLLMNSLYGKFGQKDTSERLVRCTISEIIEKNLNNLRVFNDFFGLYIEESELPVTQRLAIPIIAALVTARARCYLHSCMEDIGGVLYVDTDAIATQNTIPAHLLHDTVLGKWKVEHSDVILDIRGKKSYVMYNDDMTVRKLRQKGASIGSIPTHIDLCNNRFTGYNVSPTKIKTFMKNPTQNPSLFMKKEKTFTRQKSTHESNY